MMELCLIAVLHNDNAHVRHKLPHNRDIPCRERRRIPILSEVPTGRAVTEFPRFVLKHGISSSPSSSISLYPQNAVDGTMAVLLNAAMSMSPQWHRDTETRKSPGVPPGPAPGTPIPGPSRIRVPANRESGIGFPNFKV